MVKVVISVLELYSPFPTSSAEGLRDREALFCYQHSLDSLLNGDFLP